MAPEGEARILGALQQRWENSLMAQFPNGFDVTKQTHLFALAV